MAIAVDNLANAQELTAAEEDQAEEDKEKQLKELEKEMEALQSDGCVKGEDAASNEKQTNDKEKEDPIDDNGPKPMLPYSSMFCLSPTNP